MTILNETTDDDIILLKIGKRIYPYIVDAVADKKIGELGTINQLSGISGNTPEYEKLCGITINLYNKDDGERGSYQYPNIFLNIFGNPQPIHLSKTLLHEMRHALDSFLSKGKFYPKKHFDLLHRERPGEINAHFTEAISEIFWALYYMDKNEITSSVIMDHIKKSFNDHNVFIKNQSKYKRLINRVYQLVVRHLDSHSNAINDPIMENIIKNNMLFETTDVRLHKPTTESIQRIKTLAGL